MQYKRLISGLALAAAVAGIAVPLAGQMKVPPRPEGSFVIEQRKAGVFEAGMDVDEVIAIVGEKNAKLVAAFPEGMFQAELQIFLPGFTRGPALVAPIREFPCYTPSLWGIRINDPRFRTATGLGVGSSLADVKKVHPSAKIGDFGSDGDPSVNVPSLGLTFAFRNAVESVDTARVTGVWVVPQPVEVAARRCPSDATVQDVWQAAFDHVIRAKHPAAADAPIVLASETMTVCNGQRTPPKEMGCLTPARLVATFFTGKLRESFLQHNNDPSGVPMLNGAAAVVAPGALSRVGGTNSSGAYARVRLMRPGFSGDGKAIVYVSFQCGSLCGETWLLLLQQHDQSWTVIDEKLIAVS